MAARHGKQAYRGNEKQSWPAWVWLGIGVLLGLTLSALVLIKDWAPMLRKKNLPQPNPEATAPKEPEQAVADEAGKKPAPPKKTFDFYQVLPEMEVVIPDAELSAKARAEQQRQQQAVAQAQAGNAPAAADPPTHQLPRRRRPAEAARATCCWPARTPTPRRPTRQKQNLHFWASWQKCSRSRSTARPSTASSSGPIPNASETETAKTTLADNGVKAIPMKQAPNQ